MATGGHYITMLLAIVSDGLFTLQFYGERCYESIYKVYSL